MTASRSFLNSDRLYERIVEYARTKSPGDFLAILLEIERHTLDINGSHNERAEIVLVTRAWMKAFRPLPDPKQAAEECGRRERAEKRMGVKEVWRWLAALATAASEESTPPTS